MFNISLTVADHPQKEGVVIVRASAPCSPESESLIRTAANYIRRGHCVQQVAMGYGQQHQDVLHLLHALLATYEYHDGERRPWPVTQLVLFEANGLKTCNFFIQLFRSSEQPLLKRNSQIAGIPFCKGDIIVPIDVDSADLLFKSGMLVDSYVIQRLTEGGKITGTSIGLCLYENYKEWRLARDEEQVEILLSMANRRYCGDQKDFDGLLFPQLLDACQTLRTQARPPCDFDCSS